MAVCYKEITSIPVKYIAVLHVARRTDSCDILWCAVCIKVNNSDNTAHIVEQLIMLVTFLSLL